jgi:ribonuclease HII
MARGPLRPPLPPRGAVLGLDEAGRGSLVGPLVVGGFLTDAERLPELTALGVRDSKELSPARREEIFAELPHVGRPFAVPLPPSRVDHAVRRGQLNTLEITAFAQLVRCASPDTVYVDACDPVAERFGRRLSQAAGTGCPVDARHHADRDLVVVGAASIVAKVLRDRMLARLRERLGPGLGSGYPSDETTVSFVRTALAAGGPTPSWLRSSWATSQRLMVARSTRPLEAFGP